MDIAAKSLNKPQFFQIKTGDIIIFPAFFVIFPAFFSIFPPDLRPIGPGLSVPVGLQGVDPPGEGQLQKEEEEPATAEPGHLSDADFRLGLCRFQTVD